MKLSVSLTALALLVATASDAQAWQARYIRRPPVKPTLKTERAYKVVGYPYGTDVTTINPLGLMDLNTVLKTIKPVKTMDSTQAIAGRGYILAKDPNSNDLYVQKTTLLHTNASGKIVTSKNLQVQRVLTDNDKVVYSKEQYR